MISKKRISFINSLKLKKFRQESGLFVAEGSKIVPALIEGGMELHSVYTTDSSIFNQLIKPGIEVIELSEQELSKISFLETPNKILGLFKIPQPLLKNISFNGNLILALDGISDPGNLGTIIRIAHWFGIRDIVCSEDTVDAFNPKVVQSTMGSLSSVNIHYTSLKLLIGNVLNEGIDVYAALMKGKSVQVVKPVDEGVIILGSESHGIREEILTLKGNIIPITIPAFDPSNQPESLNVAIAASVILSCFRL